MRRGDVSFGVSVFVPRESCDRVEGRTLGDREERLAQTHSGAARCAGPDEIGTGSKYTCRFGRVARSALTPTKLEISPASNAERMPRNESHTSYAAEFFALKPSAWRVMRKGSTVYLHRQLIFFVYTL